MTMIAIRFSCLLMIALTISCASAPTPVASQTEKAAEVESFFLSGIDAFNRHELDVFLEQFGDDIEMYTPTGWLRGKAAVRERFASTFSQFPRVRMEVDNLKVRPVSEETFIADFVWRVYPMGQGPAFHGVGSGVYVRRGSSWQEVLEHETVTKIDEGLPGARE